MSASETAGRHDSGQRRRAKRSGRERGCWTYIPFEVLQAAGVSEREVYYRTWPGRKRTVLVQLYETP